ncbi:hypothetical protein C5167_013619 [Papaver somniferum]|uniref:Neprosin PEP catalytic domain-containing protein n=1 Tax=Papaver somniferum TaxID=3469 RepID=A0A4Y7J3Y1_PAPSO|nr:hypothetical protein C5167_013619 [Papaver somniferum]
MSKITELTCWILILTIFVKEGLVEERTTRRAINKNIIKTIKVEKAEIINCYDIYRQPSLNHPLLHNHTIQIRPSSYPEGTKLDNLGTLRLTQTWHKYGLCPEGTIPIRRKGKSYNPTLLRKHHNKKLSPNKTLVTSQSKNTVDDHIVHEYAIIGVQGNFFGGQAKINLWKPFTETNEMSISQIWVSAGEHEHLNTVEVGWQVSFSSKIISK